MEDSRFASDALRLMCLRSGGRLRRAETMAAARVHLRLYLPDVVLIDLGLPDGRGEVLIRALARSRMRPALLSLSGDPAARPAALAAGADGFLEKPVAGLQVFQTAVLRLIGARPPSPRRGPHSLPDPLALQDDLAHAGALGAGTRRGRPSLCGGVLAGVARASGDCDLAQAAAAALRGDTTARTRVGDLVAQRRASPDAAAFGRSWA
ncbi:response regulator [Gemmobacter lanyuensis]